MQVDSYPLSDLRKLGKSPIKVDILLKLLENYPNQSDRKILAEGFLFGFRVGYEGPRLPTVCRNLVSAFQNNTELEQKFLKELELNRIAGPFSYRPFTNLRLSPIGLVPKKSSGWRLIHNLSHPLGKSVNSHIDPENCSVQYTSFDKVLCTISEVGPNSLMGRMDVSSAFRLLPIHPDDFVLFGFKFNDYFFFDKCLPMGCSASCQLFEKFATFIEWLVRCRSKSSSVEHYLDDFFFVGKAYTEDCQFMMSTFRDICCEIGIPLAEDKTIGPSSTIIFLGLEIDTEKMVVRIPFEKLNETREKLLVILRSKKVTLRMLQSLVGLLNFCARAIPPVRAFNRRFCDAMSGVRKPEHFIRVSHNMKEDIIMWLKFLDEFNGTRKFGQNIWLTNSQLNLYTDSTGNCELGCGVYFSGHWAYFPWPIEWTQTEIMLDMTFLELVPILLAIYLFDIKFLNKQIMFHTDNKALVAILNKKSSKSCRVMQLVRPLVLKTMLCNMQFKACHIEGRFNCIADAISRKQWERFRRIAPTADVLPTPIPRDFLSLISNLRLRD